MNQPNTRRGCLSDVSSLYDPLGMVGPVTLHAKRILQMTSKLNVGWDEQLPDVLLSSWLKWKVSLSGRGELRIPRSYFPEETPVSIELHHFGDASEEGYGTVSYLRKVKDDGTAHCSFVMAKGRTAPSVFVSVPRLELQAAVVASRVDRHIRRELDLEVDRVAFWTDSRIILQYIRNESMRFKTYVANRVTEIRDSSRPDQWRHVPGKDNPADDISRGQSVEVFMKNKRWFKGPDFLQEREENWPVTDVGPLPAADPEIKQEKVVGLILAPPACSTLDQMLKRCSSWVILQRRVAILMKFCDYIRAKSSGKTLVGEQFRKITVNDLEKARLAVVKYVQKEAYGQEIADLQKTGRIKASSQLKSLNPVIIDGVLRVGGRLSRAPLSHDAKFPMIILRGSHLASILICHFHAKVAHAGQEQVLAALRETFWIQKGQIAVRKIIRSCIGCQRHQAKRMHQLMADLPRMRLQAFEPPAKKE
ncbi:uncharacterized protein LOC135494320 [Lineus longissimus]|uniref:uncharacterized protein LOC135494320 n=1 Tax=Lineus longissimus TaxID=88925 RepID=UPI00315C66CF